jgi:hypothetical protein
LPAGERLPGDALPGNALEKAGVLAYYFQQIPRGGATMAKARKATLVCRPCDTEVIVTDLGAAIVECYKCGMELEPSARVPGKALVAKSAKKKLPAEKATARKPAAKKAAPKKKK